ncbi:MAG: hypothetical protein U0556_01365 [Dehalococcoidia bacterium]
MGLAVLALSIFWLWQGATVGAVLSQRSFVANEIGEENVSLCLDNQTLRYVPGDTNPYPAFLLELPERVVLEKYPGAVVEEVEVTHRGINAAKVRFRLENEGRTVQRSAFLTGSGTYLNLSGANMTISLCNVRMLRWGIRSETVLP